MLTLSPWHFDLRVFFGWLGLPRGVVAAVWMVLLTSTFSVAAYDTQTLPHAKVVDRTIAIIELPPFAMLVEGKPAGIYVDIVRELDQRTGTKTHIVPVPIRRGRRMLMEGAADYTFMPNGALAAQSYEPLAKIGAIDYMVWPRRGLVIRGFGDMQGLVFSAFRSGYFASIFDQEPLMEYVPVDELGHQMQLVEAGRVDAMTGIASTILFEIERNKWPTDLLGTPFLLGQGDIWMYRASGNKRVDTDQSLVAAILAMEAEKRFEWYRAQYVNNKDPY